MGPEELKRQKAIDDLLKAVDVACWAWSVQKQSRRKGVVDWRTALDDLVEAFGEYQLKTSNQIGILSEVKNELP